MKEFDFEKVPIVEIANEILLDGVKKGASDIHFDPTKDGIKIRMRVDGILYDYASVPADFKRNMVSRIKMIASMNIMETRLPQDGAIKSKIGEKTLDLRVSSLPTNIGEKVVLRILDYSKSLQGLESLGFSEHNLNKIFKMIDIPNGIVLVTGATGSGKSTTVYSILQKLNTSEVNIITVEDPVEMDVEGINQVQAQQEIGLDFATVLRSILRQDPDIIMIGEIRDGETASIAVRASITGHKVLSTIHTNSALNTIERLTDMGIERYLIGTSLNGVISQKLARKLCPHCRIERDTTEYEKELFKKVLHKDIDKIHDLNPEGCEHCFKGYKGRICIAEVLVITDEVRSAITNAESKEVMRKLVYLDANTHTLLEDGLEKVLIGETNFEEILKLVDLENDLAIHKAHYNEIEARLNGTTLEKKTDEESTEEDDDEVEYVYVDENGNEISEEEYKKLGNKDEDEQVEETSDTEEETETPIETKVTTSEPTIETPDTVIETTTPTTEEAKPNIELPTLETSTAEQTAPAEETTQTGNNQLPTLEVPTSVPETTASEQVTQNTESTELPTIDSQPSIFETPLPTPVETPVVEPETVVETTNQNDTIQTTNIDTDGTTIEFLPIDNPTPIEFAPIQETQQLNPIDPSTQIGTAVTINNNPTNIDFTSLVPNQQPVM